MSRGTRPAGGAGQVRIIGGAWRGRRVPVLPLAAVRPTADRVRETLFNWLAPRMVGARCLDLFAGTGVLGFEALSRGARAVTLIDNEPRIVAQLEATRAQLEAGHADILGYDACSWLRQRPPVAYDIVFCDPPFAADRGFEILELLSRGWVAAEGVVYVEGSAAPMLPAGWTALRQGRTRQAVFSLVTMAGYQSNPNGDQQ
ncbi:MAG: 16S rRNA (guanine(966)-N(2))-methyltransferase RsmD [Gammaproteobacteria bacterium]|nr:16S rRNA (guanine(966)-N(2))-methyltransferase RsmD [Gammaproteobacteria bacterium]